MKITFIGHASILIEAGGITILSDPWRQGPCFGAQWWNYPLPYLEAIEACRIDYIYISHGHNDHLHPDTLRTLNKEAKVLVSATTDLAASIRELGFEVIEVSGSEALPLGNNGVSCRIIETYDGDTLMTVTDETEVCVNLNDALHSAPDGVQRSFIPQLKALYPKIDYVFCGYGVASHFPNCYVIPGKDREATAARRQQYFNRQWARLIGELAPVYGFPFAADVVFLEKDLFWVNEVTHNAERPTIAFRELYPHSPVITIDLAPGFAIDNGHVTREVLRQPLLASELQTSCADEIVQANRHGSISDEAIWEVTVLLERNLNMCAEYLRSYEGNYSVLIRLRDGKCGFCFKKNGRELSVTPLQVTAMEGHDLVYTTRLPYLESALTRPYEDEILFVGSGGVFEYAQESSARRNLHRELIPLLRQQDTPMPSRYGNHSRAVFTAKQRIKRMLGRTGPDLYDLGEWTVFNHEKG